MTHDRQFERLTEPPFGRKDSLTNAHEPTQWLSNFWSTLPERERDVLSRRGAGVTLDAIGHDFGLSRERVRQIQNKAEEQLASIAKTQAAQLDQILEELADGPAVDHRVLLEVLPIGPAEAQIALLNVMRIRHPRTWDGELQKWWCKEPEELNRRLNAIVALAPLSHENMTAAMEQVGLRIQAPVSGLLSSENSRVVQHELGWVRPSRVNRDLAFLWLEKQGSPCPASDIAVVTGNPERTIRETMRRDTAFAQVRPEGTWALAAWRTPGADNRYSNADEAVIDVLRQMGPLELNELRAEAMRRYPVSTWRISQCLSSASVGQLPDGRYDLAERGAVPVEDAEPNRPAHMQVSGNTIGIRLEVNHDLLRGSGIGVNRWLTWYLGLRIVPSVRTFDQLDPPGVLTVKRASSNSQISSLRTAALAMDLVEGCQMALILNTERNTARIRHACSSGDCPAKSLG
jgi:hypothetical protein